MTLTPEDIQSKQFHVRFRGFDVEEVDGFLEQVAESYLMLIEENRTLKGKIDSLTSDLEGFREDESSFKNAIVSAQKVVDEMKKKSRSEANRMLMQANAEVNQLRDEANKEIADLETKVDQLKGMESKIINDLRGVLNDYLAQLDNRATTVDTPPAAKPQESEPRPAAPISKRQLPDVEEPGLYEKITVEDDDPWLAQAEAELQGDEEAGEEEFAAGPVIGGLDLEEEEPSVTIPNMDDEVMFSLDDPLDKGAGRKKR